MTTKDVLQVPDLFLGVDQFAEPYVSWHCPVCTQELELSAAAVGLAHSRRCACGTRWTIQALGQKE